MSSILNANSFFMFSKNFSFDIPLNKEDLKKSKNKFKLGITFSGFLCYWNSTRQYSFQIIIN